VVCKMQAGETGYDSGESKATADWSDDTDMRESKNVGAVGAHC
jgi:hypothetical protein